MRSFNPLVKGLINHAMTLERLKQEERTHFHTLLKFEVLLANPKQQLKGIYIYLYNIL